MYLFIREWCLKAREKAKAEEEAKKAGDTLESFGAVWYAEVVEPTNTNPRNFMRVLEKDVHPTDRKSVV